MADLSAWLLSIGAFAAVVICTAIAARSIAGDPPRGRRRCPRCWHELGPDALRCAECGHEARGESDVSRNRRQPLRAVLAIVAVVAVAAATRVRLLDRGPWSMAPTSVLLWLAPGASGGGYRSATWELAYRIRAGSAGDEQVRDALRLFIAGDEAARPPSVEWRAKYRDLGSAVIARLGATSPLLLELFTLPPVYEVAFVGDAESVAPLLLLDADVWWPPSSEATLEVGLPDGTARRATYRPDSRFPPLILELPRGIKAGNEITLRLAPTAVQATGAPCEATTVRVALPASNPPATGWTSTDAVELREAVASVFVEGLIVWADGAPRAGLRFDHRRTADEEFADTAIGLRVEVLERGVVRRTSRMWWMAGEQGAQPKWLPSIEDADAMARLAAEGSDADADAWTLRIRGDEQLARYAAALRRIGIDERDGAKESPRSLRWFSGSVELPLRIERNPAPAPPRRWRLAPLPDTDTP